jgi:hypothetical protein
MLGVLLALVAVAAPADPAVAGGWKAPRQLGVGLTVDSRWIAVEGYYSVRDRGAAARGQAWAGGAPSRGATRMRVVRLGGVPNLIGRIHQHLVAARVLGDAACAVARHFLGVATTPRSAVKQERGARDADRR